MFNELLVNSSCCHTQKFRFFSAPFDVEENRPKIVESVNQVLSFASGILRALVVHFQEI